MRLGLGEGRRGRGRGQGKSRNQDQRGMVSVRVSGPGPALISRSGGEVILGSGVMMRVRRGDSHSAPCKMGRVRVGVSSAHMSAPAARQLWTSPKCREAETIRTGTLSPKVCRMLCRWRLGRWPGRKAGRRGGGEVGCVSGRRECVGERVRACEGHNSFGLGLGRTAATRWGLGSQIARLSRCRQVPKP